MYQEPVNLGPFQEMGFHVLQKRQLVTALLSEKQTEHLDAVDGADVLHLHVSLLHTPHTVTIRATSDPATIQRLNAQGSVVNPISPPDSLTVALFCS